MYHTVRFALTVVVSLAATLSMSAFAQDETQDQPAPSMEQEQATQGLGEEHPRLRMLVDVRIKRQRMRIHQAVESGTMKKEKALELGSELDQLEARINSQRANNGGKLKVEQLREAENSLNQSNEIIKTFENAGTSVVNKDQVLGPNWTPGKDGAQQPNALLHGMKEQQRMEDRQYKQAMEQKVEQQQLDYEKSQLRQFQGQRDSILQQKDDLQKERQATGAN